MDRRAFVCGLAGCAAGLPSLAYADFFPGRSAPPQAWKKIPSITVVAEENDFRIPAVDDAVSFWNRELAKLMISFRLGSVTRVVGVIPRDELRALSMTPMKGDISELPESIRGVDGDVVIAMSDGDFRSFAFRPAIVQKAVVAIRIYPNTGKRGYIFAIAHELGHVIGLRHNTDPVALMCGPPASCWTEPAALRYESLLTEADKIALLKLYPPRLAG